MADETWNVAQISALNAKIQGMIVANLPCSPTDVKYNTDDFRVFGKIAWRSLIIQKENMRKPKYLSASSISQFYKDKEEFYLKYMVDNRPPRMPQTQPMSIGSAFDAYVKNWISERLFGKKKEFELESLFLQQVETQNQKWAWKHGKFAFEAYKKSGALSDLMIELELADGDPQFEFTVKRTIGGVPLLGKPDLYFKTRAGNNIIYDWKVNGYCSKYNTSPKKEYMMVRDGWEGNASRGAFSMHKNCQPMMHKDIMINISSYFETIDKSWASQLAIYAWLMGAEVGSDFVIGIEQLCCKGGEYGQIRVASHRSRISKAWQHEFFAQILHVWECVESRTITDNQDELGELHKAYTGHDSEWLSSITREHRNF